MKTNSGFVLALFVVVQLSVCSAQEKCWVSSPPYAVESNLKYLDTSITGETKCFDKSTLTVSEANGKTDVMVRIYSKASSASKIELAKKGVSCTYDYQDAIFSCPSKGSNGCVKQILSWVYLNERYEPTFKIDANVLASIGAKMPIFEMDDNDNKQYKYLLIIGNEKDIIKPTDNKESVPIKKAPRSYSADDGTDTQ